MPGNSSLKLRVLHHVHFVFKFRENRKWVTHRDFMRFRAIWVYGVSKSNVKLSHPERVN